MVVKNKMQYNQESQESSGDLFEIVDWSDGNDKYKIYENTWQIVKNMFGGGKCALLNIDNKTILSSISRWKIRVKRS